MDKEFVMSPSDRSLFVVGGTVSLLQFNWLYHSLPLSGDWDVLVHNYGTKEMTDAIAEQCERSGLFREIIREKTTLMQDVSFCQKAAIFTKMVKASFLGRKKEFSRDYIKGEIGGKEYKRVVLYSDRAIISGCFMQLADTIDVSILEEGMNDYLPRRRCIALRDVLNPTEIAGMFIARMGFGSVSFSVISAYRNKTTKNCTKYVSIPEKLMTDEYREVLPLWKSIEDDGRVSAADDTIRKCYPGISSVENMVCDAVLVTAPMQEFFTSQDDVLEQVGSFLKENGIGSLILKRHPRDEHTYSWDGVTVVEPPADIPAEVLLRFATFTSLIAVNPTTVLLDAIAKDYPYTVLKLKNGTPKYYDLFLAVPWLLEKGELCA